MPWTKSRIFSDELLEIRRYDLDHGVDRNPSKIRDRPCDPLYYHRHAGFPLQPLKSARIVRLGQDPIVGNLASDLPDSLRAIHLDADRQEILAWGDGYGWTRTVNHGLKEPAYFMSGEGPGFASFMIYLPKLKAEIIVLSNAQMPIPTAIGFDLAAMLEGRDYHAPELRATPLAADEVSQVVGRFKFGPDFYRPNATLEVAAGPGGLILRWPGGPDSPVLVTDGHHFIDRHYWTRFSVDDDATGHAAELTFGKFKGQRSTDNPSASTQ